MSLSAEKLLEQIEATKKIYVALSAKAENDPEDMSVIHCLQPTDDHLKGLVRELRRVNRTSSFKVLATNGERLPRIVSLSEVKTFFHLLGYYATKGLQKIEEEINALKSEMVGSSIRGEAKISPEENLAVLEDAVLLGYWKASYGRTNV